MVNRLYTYLFLICISVLSVFAKNTDKDNPVIYIEYSTDNPVSYINQVISVTLTLYSSDPEVAFAESRQNISLKKGMFASIRKIDRRSSPFRKVVKGVELYGFPLETYLISFDKTGNYEFAERSFEVGISYPIIVNDPIWGRIQSSEIQNYSIPVKNFSIKIKDLPNPPAGSHFSGAVGQFNIETFVPKGDIIVNEEAVAYIIVKGTGHFESSTLPEYREAFSDGMKLKSVSENRSEYIENGKLISEIRLECTFIPERENNVKIGKVSFDFFDVNTGKYTTVVSSPVDVKIKSSISKRDRITI